MKKLSVFSVVLVLLCLPVLSSCSKKSGNECFDCYNDCGSHVTLSFGMKDGETKVYDLSKETVKIYLDFHIEEKIYYSEFNELYGKGIYSCYAIVSDFDKPKEEIPGPRVLMQSVSADMLCEMTFQDTYYTKVKVDPHWGDFHYKWYRETLEIVYSSTAFDEGEHFFFVSTSRNLCTQYNYRGYYYKREGNRLEIRKQTGEDDYWGDNNFDKEAEQEFWANYVHGYGGY